MSVKRYSTAAERQAAYRARRASEQLQEPDPKPVPVEAVVAKPPEPVDAQLARAIRDAEAINQRLPVRTPALTEDQYVQLGPGVERYLRWRYRGYCAGVVASL